MTRRDIRENIFELLFRMEFHSLSDFDEQSAIFFDKFEEVSEEDLFYIKKKSLEILNLANDIDEKINSIAQNWKTSRMGKVDLVIIRLAYYEIFRDEDIPEKVAINEAVELAKKFGTENSGNFVNGILAKLI